MGIKVCKFGGSSVADPQQILKVKSIVEADDDRKFVVPSAPGKRFKEDQKVTDLLLLCQATAAQGVPIDDLFQRVADRYLGIVDQLKLDIDLQPQLDKVKADLLAGATVDYAGSRGEFLHGPIIAAVLGYEFIDAAEVIFFDTRGRIDRTRTYNAIRERLEVAERAVIPGFYGTGPDGNVKTFSRGGSDITGSIIAAGIGADIYENWTDVSGLLMADPRIVDNPKPIETITYRELRELAYMGATVLHDEAIFPVREAGIPVNIRNTNQPDDPGSMIVRGADSVTNLGSITGIAGRKDFTIITIEKALMNSELGFGRRVLSALERHGVNFEHLPSGIDTMSIVVADSEIEGKVDDVVKAIQAEVEPDTIDVNPEAALLATVGRGMAHTPGIAARLFAALAEAKVNVRMIDQGSSELNIIVGIEVADFDKAMRAIYNAFVNN